MAFNESGNIEKSGNLRQLNKICRSHNSKSALQYMTDLTTVTTNRTNENLDTELVFRYLKTRTRIKATLASNERFFCSQLRTSELVLVNKTA